MPVTKFEAFPELITERLLLRQLTLADAEAIFQLRSNREVMKYIARPIAESLEDAKSWIRMVNDAMQNEEGVPWAISLKEDAASLIGIIGFWRTQKQHSRTELGYMLMPSFQGKGYVTEAIEKVVHFGFQHMQFHSIEAVIDPRNIASAKTLEKSNFIKEAHFKENHYWNGVFCDTAVYSKLTYLKEPVLDLQ